MCLIEDRQTDRQSLRSSLLEFLIFFLALSGFIHTIINDKLDEMMGEMKHALQVEIRWGIEEVKKLVDKPKAVVTHTKSTTPSPPSTTSTQSIPPTFVIQDEDFNNFPDVDFSDENSQDEIVGTLLDTPSDMGPEKTVFGLSTA